MNPTSTKLSRTLRCTLSLFLFCVPLLCQQQTGAPPMQPGHLPNQPTQDEPKESKRLFGVVPNFRTSPNLKTYKPISPREKFIIASQDAFDRGTVVLAGVFAGISQLTNSEPSFGQGAAGYGRYFGTSYADFVIGNYMTEAFLPTLLHQDPRYFRKGTGSGRSRLTYAAGQIFITHSDRNTIQINYSELVGNSAAAAISTAYYPHSRDATDAITKLVTQLAIDATSNELKEFWPEIARKFSRHHKNDHP